MRWKIQKSMMVILAVTLVLSYAILSVILYNRNLTLLRESFQQEAGIYGPLSIFPVRSIWSRWIWWK